MASGRVEIITSVEQRRRWSAAEEQRLVAATLEAGASVAAVAQQAGIDPSQLWGWRRQLRAAAPAGFAPVRITADAPAAIAKEPGTIEIELAGARLRVSGVVDPATLTAALSVLMGGLRR